MQNQALAGEKAFFDSERETKTKIADRKLQLGLLKYNTAQARAAQLLKEGKSNLGAGIARFSGGKVANPYGSAGEPAATTTGAEGGVSVGNEEG